MVEDILKELNTEGLRSVFLKYTRKAFNSIPKIDNPRILDIGCGTGIPTLELAKLSNGEIFGIDIDQEALNKLNQKIKQKGLNNRVKIFNRSIYETKFMDETFDILWEEGVLHMLDFNKVMTECSRILKVNGYMITGEANNWVDKKRERYPKFGFKIVKQIPWAEECWWKEYYAPLEEKIKILREKYDKVDKIEEIKQHIREIEMVKKNPSGFDCTTYVMKKIN
ncbi:MAG: class I SAM-dependent methyltransferase [Promethearchaeota archaeon]